MALNVNHQVTVHRSKILYSWTKVLYNWTKILYSWTSWYALDGCQPFLSCTHQQREQWGQVIHSLSRNLYTSLKTSWCQRSIDQYVLHGCRACWNICSYLHSQELMKHNMPKIFTATSTIKDLHCSNRCQKCYYNISC